MRQQHAPDDKGYLFNGNTARPFSRGVIFRTLRCLTRKEESMPRREAVLVKCTFTRGGFPSELVFHVPAPEGGELAGVASRDYCFAEEKTPLMAEPARGDSLPGYFGVLLGAGESPGASRIYLPDSEVYEIPNTFCNGTTRLSCSSAW
jgi:hypothetical protein